MSKRKAAQQRFCEWALNSYDPIRTPRLEAHLEFPELHTEIRNAPLYIVVHILYLFSTCHIST